MTMVNIFITAIAYHQYHVQVHTHILTTCDACVYVCVKKKNRKCVRSPGVLELFEPASDLFKSSNECCCRKNSLQRSVLLLNVQEVLHILYGYLGGLRHRIPRLNPVNRPDKVYSLPSDTLPSALTTRNLRISLS